MLKTILLIACLVGSSPTSSESLLQFLGRISGISATSSTQKSFDGQKQSSGRLCLVTLPEVSRKALTTDSSYRSPVFEPAGKAVYALKGSDVIRVSLQPSFAEKKVCTVTGIHRLVGFARENPEEVVILAVSKESRTTCGVLDLKTCDVRRLPFDETLKDHREMMIRLESSERTYGNIQVYPQTRSADGIGGKDIYVDKPDGTHMNVSEGGNADCNQPALSHDQRLVVYVKTGR